MKTRTNSTSAAPLTAEADVSFAERDELAAITLPENSVGTIQIKREAVTSPKVKDGSLGAVALAPAARRSLRGRMGPPGPVGVKG